MPNGNENCAILIPVHHAIEPECEDALRELSNRGYPVIVLRGSSAIDMARNDLANQAIDAGYEETFWIDADVVFRPDDVDKLRAYNLPFVAGLYPRKGRKGFACKFWPTTEDIVFGIGGGLRSIEYVGFGFTHVRAEVYRKMTSELKLPRVEGGYTLGKKIIPYFLPMILPDVANPDELVYWAEDASFCKRAQMAGFDVKADTSIRLEHIGPRKWSWEDFGSQPTYNSLKFSTVEEKVDPNWKFPEDVRGWMTEEEGAGLARLARGKDVLEVGSYCGRSSICMAQTARSLTCVDPFDCRDTPGDGSTFEEFCANLERYKVKANVFRSLFAAVEIRDRFDLIFIDGAHDEASVNADACLATRLLAPRGLIAFHDYRPVSGHQDGGWHPGVTVTVNRLVEQGATLVETFGTVAVVRPTGRGLKPTQNAKYIDFLTAKERHESFEASCR